MTFTTLFIDKGGINKDIPGFSEIFSASELGFWGEYSFLDFSLYNVNSIQNIFICEKEIRKCISNVMLKWDERRFDFFPYRSDLDSVESFLRKIEDDILVFYNINFAAAVEENEVRNAVKDFADRKSGKIEKISVNSIPVDIYIADKKTVLKNLDSMQNRIKPETNIFDFILEEILATEFENMIDIKGDILFNNSISQFYNNNIALLNRNSSDLMESFMKNTPPPHEKDSVIGRKGDVVNSIISSNSRIEGYVENSVIFSGVNIKQNSVIRNSVIMSGNQIGKNVNIENTLILPNFKNPVNISNIQDKCIIGANKSKARNSDYPEQIKEGLTVVGMNSIIPSKFVAEPGSLIGADVISTRLKELKKIKKSGSVV